MKKLSGVVFCGVVCFIQLSSQQGYEPLYAQQYVPMQEPEGSMRKVFKGGYGQNLFNIYDDDYNPADPDYSPPAKVAYYNKPVPKVKYSPPATTEYPPTTTEYAKTTTEYKAPAKDEYPAKTEYKDPTPSKYTPPRKAYNEALEYDLPRLLSYPPKYIFPQEAYDPIESEYYLRRPARPFSRRRGFRRFNRRRFFRRFNRRRDYDPRPRRRYDGNLPAYYDLPHAPDYTPPMQEYQPSRYYD